MDLLEGVHIVNFKDFKKKNEILNGVCLQYLLFEEYFPYPQEFF